MAFVGRVPMARRAPSRSPPRPAVLGMVKVHAYDGTHPDAGGDERVHRHG